MCDAPAHQMLPRPPVSTLEPGSPLYPENLLHWTTGAPGSLWAVGPAEMLRNPVVGLVCSKRLPGRLMVEAYEWARQMKLSGAAVAGGFHSPMERECLRLMLHGRTRLVVCPARGIARLRIPAEWRSLIASGRLLILSAFAGSVRRATRGLAEQRNRFVTALAHALLIPHAGRGSATERLALEAARRGTPLYTFPGPENDNLLQIGARAWGTPM